MTDTSTFQFPSKLFDQIRSALPENQPIYLVGGAVRDALLGKPTHDFDFIVPEDVFATGRRFADALNAAYYPLDEVRETVRIVLISPDEPRQVFDFATQRGPNLEEDLRSRDFTINAMALAVHEPQKIIDPLGGAKDLKDGLLRPCSETAFLDDPVRIIRAIRQAVSFKLYIPPETKQLITQSVDQLPDISPERIRDELFRIFDGSQPAAALRSLYKLDALKYLLPELDMLKDTSQSHPHISDAWSHSWDCMRKLDDILKVLARNYDPEVAANWPLGMVSIRLGRFREQLDAHLAKKMNPDRSMRSILLFAALYHDIGKARKLQISENDRIQFLKHAQIGAEMMHDRAQKLRLSNHEIDRLSSILRHHLRPLILTQTGALPSRRAVYRFFRDCKASGVDVCLLSLADVMATYGPTLPKDMWISHLDTLRALLEAWWERKETDVAPTALINGNDLIETFGVEPGPLIGYLLEAIRESQAADELISRDDALQFANAWLNENQ
jgi:poly(A) polymerase